MKTMTFEETCQKIASLKLVQASSGNLSERSKFNEGEFFITSTGCWFETMDHQQKVRCSLETKKKIDKDSPDPSSEILMHALTLENRPDVNVVLHYQPVHGTLISCIFDAELLPDFNVIPEVPYYINKISYVTYHKPGSVELAQCVSNALKEQNLVIMRNHGLTVVGCNFEQVLQRAIFFELACEILVKARDKWELDRIYKL
jgi:ribulose-5-phosphate 4-epimerase/fuculose-1-phosphate aldolase